LEKKTWWTRGRRLAAAADFYPGDAAGTGQPYDVDAACLYIYVQINRWILKMEWKGNYCALISVTGKSPAVRKRRAEKFAV
jgi:hypothetical protein